MTCNDDARHSPGRHYFLPPQSPYFLTLLTASLRSHSSLRWRFASHCQPRVSASATMAGLEWRALRIASIHPFTRLLDSSPQSTYSAATRISSDAIVRWGL